MVGGACYGAWDTRNIGNGSALLDHEIVIQIYGINTDVEIDTRPAKRQTPSSVC